MFIQEGIQWKLSDSQDEATMTNNWKEQPNYLLLKYSENNPQLRKVVGEWNGIATGEFDTRSGPKAAEIFQAVATESDEGCIVLALIFYELFQEYGEFPRQSIFDEK